MALVQHVRGSGHGQQPDDAPQQAQGGAHDDACPVRVGVSLGMVWGEHTLDVVLLEEADFFSDREQGVWTAMLASKFMEFGLILYGLGLWGRVDCMSARVVLVATFIGLVIYPE